MRQFISLLVLLIVIISSLKAQESGWVEKEDYFENKWSGAAALKVRISSDNQFMYTIHADSVARKWDFETGELLGETELLTHQADIDPDEEIIGEMLGKMYFVGYQTVPQYAEPYMVFKKIGSDDYLYDGGSKIQYRETEPIGVNKTEILIGGCTYDRANKHFYATAHNEKNVQAGYRWGGKLLVYDHKSNKIKYSSGGEQGEYYHSTVELTNKGDFLTKYYKRGYSSSGGTTYWYEDIGYILKFDGRNYSLYDSLYNKDYSNFSDAYFIKNNTQLLLFFAKKENERYSYNIKIWDKYNHNNVIELLNSDENNICFSKDLNGENCIIESGGEIYFLAINEVPGFWKIFDWIDLSYLELTVDTNYLIGLDQGRIYKADIRDLKYLSLHLASDKEIAYVKEDITFLCFTDKEFEYIWEIDGDEVEGIDHITTQFELEGFKTVICRIYQNGELIEELSKQVEVIPEFITDLKILKSDLFGVIPHEVRVVNNTKGKIQEAKLGYADYNGYKSEAPNIDFKDTIRFILKERNNFRFNVELSDPINKKIVELEGMIKVEEIDTIESSSKFIDLELSQNIDFQKKGSVKYYSGFLIYNNHIHYNYHQEIFDWYIDSYGCMQPGDIYQIRSGFVLDQDLNYLPKTYEGHWYLDTNRLITFEENKEGFRDVLVLDREYNELSRTECAYQEEFNDPIVVGLSDSHYLLYNLPLRTRTRIDAVIFNDKHEILTSYTLPKFDVRKVIELEDNVVIVGSSIVSLKKHEKHYSEYQLQDGSKVYKIQRDKLLIVEPSGENRWDYITLDQELNEIGKISNLNRKLTPGKDANFWYGVSNNQKQLRVDVYDKNMNLITSEYVTRIVEEEKQFVDTDIHEIIQIDEDLVLRYEIPKEEVRFLKFKYDPFANKIEFSGETIKTNAFPNPATNTLNIELEDMPNTSAELRIVNAMGQEVFSVNANDHLSGNLLTLDISALPIGMYFYRVMDNENSISGKFIKVGE